MAAQVEVQPGEVGRTVAAGRLHLNPLADSSNKSLIEIPSINQSPTITPEPNKPTPAPKPRLTPKPFSVEKNTTIKPILAPKPQTKPRPESTRPAGYKQELPVNPKPQQQAATGRPQAAATNPSRPAPTSYKVSNKLNNGQTVKPVVQPFKPVHSFADGDPTMPIPSVPAERQKPSVPNLALSKSFKDPSAAEWSGSTKKEVERGQGKIGTSLTRAKSLGFLLDVGQEEEIKDKVQPEVSVQMRPRPRTSRPRPVSAIFPGSPTKTETPVPPQRWAGRRPLSADLTSKFGSIGLSLHRNSPKTKMKESASDEDALPQKEQDKVHLSTTPQTNNDVSNQAPSDQSKESSEVMAVKETDEDKRGVSIKSRISLLLDQPSSPGAGATGQGSDPFSSVHSAPETESAVGVKQLIKQLTEDTAPAQSPVLKSSAKPRPLPLDLTKRFSSERSHDHVSLNEAADHHEISKGPHRRTEESSTPSEQKIFLDLKSPHELFMPEGPVVGLTSASKEKGSGSEVQTVRASLFENVVERYSVQMMDDGTSVNKTSDSLSSPLFISDNKDGGTLVTAPYQETVSPSGPQRVLHTFDTVPAVEENHAVSEHVPSAYWEDKAMTLHNRRSDENRSMAEMMPEAQPRYLRIGALQRWGLEQDVDMEKGMLKEMPRDELRFLDNDKGRQRVVEQDEFAPALKPKVGEQPKPRATYFALTGQMQEPLSPGATNIIGMTVPFESSQISVHANLQEKINGNPSSDGVFGKASRSQKQFEEMKMRSHVPSKENKSVVDTEAEKKSEHKKEKDRQKVKLKEPEREKQKQLEIKKQAHLEFARMKEREPQREFERQRQKAYEEEKRRAQEVDRERRREKDRQQQREEERQREQKMEELEKQQLLGFQKQKQKEIENQQLTEFEKQKLKQKKDQDEAEKLRQIALEQEMLRMKEFEKERERQRQLEKERQKEMEKERQKELEKAHQRELEKEYQKEREREKQRELEKRRQRELDQERRRKLDLERQDLENQKQRQQEQEEKQRKKDLERIKELERIQLFEFEKQRQAERQRQQAMELETQRLREYNEREEAEKREEMEKWRQRELERQRKLDLERQDLENQKQRQQEQEERQRKREVERIKELERIQLLEFEKQKQAERQIQQIIEIEKQRPREKMEREETEKKEELEKQRQRELDQERQKKLDLEKQELENQKLRQQEQEEKQRMKDLERVKELERIQLFELEKQRQAERQRQVTELEKQRLREKTEREEAEKREEMEKWRQRELERQRQLDLERLELENQKQRQREQEEKQRKEVLDRIEELERIQLLEFEMQKQAEKQRQQIAEIEKQRLREKIEREEAEKMRQIAKQQEAERQRLKERKEEQEKLKLESSPLRPKVLDLDSVCRNDQFSPSLPHRSDPATRWKEPYKPAILDIDSFTSQTQPSPSKDLFSLSNIQGLDAEFGAKLQPTPERDASWKVPSQTSGVFSSPVWTAPPQDPWELHTAEMSVDQPMAEPKTQSNKLNPEHLTKHTERLTTPQRPWSAFLDETPHLAPFPVAEINTSNPADGLPGTKGDVRSHKRSQGSRELNRLRSRSVSRRSAPASTAVETSLSRMRSRSAHRDQDRRSWQKQNVGDEEEERDSETPVCETDSQYGTWETGLRTDDSLTPATPSSESNLSPSPKKATPPQTPGDHISQSESGDGLLHSSPSENQQPLVLPVAPTTLLDNSAIRSRAQLAKKRAPRARPSRAARQSAALGGTAEESFFRDSTEAKPETKDSDSDSEEQKSRGADSGHAATAQPQRVALFPGVDPSALKAQLKKRGDSDNQIEGNAASPSQLSRSPKSPFLPRAARVLPPPGGKENGEEASPQWLKELKSKKRLSQYESES
ncbi:uncharacterized protein KZ484_004471 [Pholidichthys leucotaenia]